MKTSRDLKSADSLFLYYPLSHTLAPSLVDTWMDPVPTKLMLWLNVNMEKILAELNAKTNRNYMALKLFFFLGF